MTTTDLHIDITEDGYHYTWWNRFKVWLWNFILPPHIRLEIKKPDAVSE
jgi:hypothetical protein